MGEEWDDKIILYLYDASGSPIGMMYRTTSYDIADWDVFFFEKNLQGDIVAIYNETGTKVATYNYSDAWGNHLVSYSNSGSSTGAAYNPFRYRGYYYDTDLGMYYLQSRYYDPNTCRFISPDTLSYLGANGDLTSYNLYAYCSNNPVNFVDPSGHAIDTIWDAISLGFSIVEVVTNPCDIWAWIGLAGDLVDLIPFVTGVGETVDAIRICAKVNDAFDAADDVIDVAKFILKNSDTASDLKKATGSYEIIFASGKNYVGKGGFKRAIDSAISHAKPNKLNDYLGDTVVSINWQKAANSNAAFIDEFIKQCKRGVNNSSTYNLIWSPGRRLFFGK